MNILKKKILIVGLFLSPENEGRIIRTAADQLAELLSKNNFGIITVSTIVNRVGRLLDTIFTVISKSKAYDVAIIPLYGSFRSFIWETITAKLLKVLGKKIIIIVHGGSIPDKMRRNPKKYLDTLNAGDVVVCPSRFLCKTLAEYGVESKQIENVINIKSYRFQNKKTFGPRIFWMRTLEDIYNPEMAVRVGAILAKKYPDFRMVMAGYDHGSLKMVQSLANELNIVDKIEFPGYISNIQKNDYARELDIYICTNRIDNAPVSFIEMMAMGLPIVSVNIGGIPHLINDGYNGLLVDLDDDEKMAQSIISIIENPELGQQLVENSLKYCKRFDEQPVLQKWIEVFKELEER